MRSRLPVLIVLAAGVSCAVLVWLLMPVSCPADFTNGGPLLADGTAQPGCFGPADEYATPARQHPWLALLPLITAVGAAATLGRSVSRRAR